MGCLFTLVAFLSSSACYIDQSSNGSQRLSIPFMYLFTPTRMKLWENPGKSEETIDNPTNHGTIRLSRIVLIRIYTCLPIVENWGEKLGKSEEIIENSLNLNENLLIIRYNPVLP